jgi:hypothetical protein
MNWDDITGLVDLWDQYPWFYIQPKVSAFKTAKSLLEHLLAVGYISPTFNEIFKKYFIRNKRNNIVQLFMDYENVNY